NDRRLRGGMETSFQQDLRSCQIGVHYSGEASGDQHIVVSQKNADGTTSQQSTDFRSNGTTGSSVIPNPIETILNGFQTGSNGGRVVSFGMQ
ncbi:hypothetical protein ACFXPS_44545, partial [Nocardia sp. NPDC059091]|uniref:hypothetical protein n=1 Tax=unclassified Nocardia TaxID=2637762 RepID=UPI0036B8371D